MERTKIPWHRQAPVDAPDPPAILDGASSSADGDGVVVKTRKAKSMRLFEPKKTWSLEESQVGTLEFNKQQSKVLPVRAQTFDTETHSRKPEGLESRNSFTKHNKTFHKVFREIPENEELMHAFTCALQKEVLYHGKLYVSENYVCFHSSVLLKDTKVLIPVASVRAVKKQNMALVVPNALSIRTAGGEKYLFTSLRNRESCYKLLCCVCLHIEDPSGNSSPQISSAENGLDHGQEMTLSVSSMEDSLDFPEEVDSPLIRRSREVAHRGSGGTSSEQQDVSTVEERRGTAVSWIWAVIEALKSALIESDSRNLNVLLIIYLVLVLLLLLSSGYIGLRIVALEEQLSSMGPLPQFSLTRG